MELSECWKNKNQPQTNQAIICFVDEGMLIHRKISYYLSVKDIPNDWNILSLYEPEKQMEQTTEKTHHYKIEKMTNYKAYFIKKHFLEKVNAILSKNKNLDKLDVMNQLLKQEKTCYVFTVPLVYPVENISIKNEMIYYEYYDETNKWQQLIEECKKIIQNNISIRHMLSGLLRFSNVRELIHIFDHKLGIKEWVVNELITMGTTLWTTIDQIENVMTNKSKIIMSSEYFDKDIINKFFDKYVYQELPMCIIIPSFNNEPYYEKNLLSVFEQKYSNHRIIYIDDQSTDQTYQCVKEFIISKNQTNRVELLKQTKHGAQCCGRFIGYMMTDDDEIICNLDGDDFLYDRDDIHKFKALKYVESGYLKGLWSTYGCFYKTSGPQWMETTLKYSTEIIEKKLYRTNKFLCKHLRTGYGGLYKKIKVEDLMGPDDKFLHMCTDIATQYPVCEMAGNLHENLLKPTYIYNQDNSVRYNNSWYNLEKKDNEDNKKYFDSVIEKIKVTKQYETSDSYMTSKYYGFNMWKETMDIILLGLNQRDINYYLSKFNHEIMNTIKYNLHIINDLQEYENKGSDLVLFIDVDSTKIGSNLNPKKYMKWLELKGHVLVDDRIDISDGSYCMDEGSAYDIVIVKTNGKHSMSGYYTKESFESLIKNNLDNDNLDNNMNHRIIARSRDRMSIIVALYGIKKEWLQVAIDSVIGQTATDWNLLICDDGTSSLDYKRSMMSYLYDVKNKILGNRIRIIENLKNVGLAGTNLNMVGHVESKFIGSLDPDDALTDNAIQKVLNVYMTDCSADFVYSNFYYCDQDLMIKSNGYSKPLGDKLVIYENCVSAFRTYKKSSYHHTLGYCKTFRSAEDKDIIFKFEESGAKFVMVPECLYKYRYNPGSLARTSDGSEAFNNHKTLQYCRNAIKQSQFRRYLNNAYICDKPIDEIFIKYGMRNITMTSYEKYFNDYFDMVYCINLQINNEKFNEMKIKMHLCGIKKVKIMRFVFAKDCKELVNIYQNVIDNDLRTTNEKRENKKIIKNIGELGCSESHMYCVKDALINNYQKILILEDDVYFHKHFLIKFKEYTDQISDDWQFLMLGTSQWSWWGNAPYLKKNIYHPTRASMGTFAVAVNIKNSDPNDNLMHDLINNLSTYDSPADLGGYSKSIIKTKLTENIHSLNFLHESRYPIKHCHVFYPNLIIADTTESSLREGDVESKFLSRCLHMDWQVDNMMTFKKNNMNISRYANKIHYETILVNDYDSIYPNVPWNQDVEFCISNDLPFKIHTILLRSRNNKIMIKGDLSKSDFIYYKKRIEHFPNIRFDS